MARRSGLEKFIMAAARASAKASRQAEVNQRRYIAERARNEKALARENARLQKTREKNAKQDYLESRLEEANDQMEESNEKFQYLLNGVINETLEIDDSIDFETLKPKYCPPANESDTKGEHIFKPQLEWFIKESDKPFFASIFPFVRNKWEKKVAEKQQLYSEELKSWEDLEKKKKIAAEKKNAEYEKLKKQYDDDYNSKCHDIDDFKKQYLELNEDAVTSYIGMVLERSEYSIEWDREYKVAYNQNAKELLIELKLPLYDVIPKVVEFKYVKTKDEIEKKLRKKNEIDDCYKSLISSIALRTIHEVVESDQANATLIISFNGIIETINPINGHQIKPCVISISVTKTEFENINLSKIDPVKCIQSLSAIFSSAPNELIAIKPIREFSMIDKRYVQEEDIASTIDTRPNLMDLNPFEFENLISNLFSKMGLETKQTRSSKDGGVDAVAFDTRPILGGKLVIQAKRYKNTVGVSAVRDLYGTMINEGATKGILVSSSQYGPDAYTFSKDKPIELIDGPGLLYLLGEVGIKAKIIMPE